MQLSVSGALSNMYRQDVLTNNLSNLNTPGFKPDTPVLRQRDPVREEDGVGFLPSNALLERLGAGTVPAFNRISFEQGALESTGNPLDAAIEGDGFFVVRTGGDGLGDTLRLTRDGRFTLDGEGRLVMATGGAAVLDDGNGEITLDPKLPVTIDRDGSIRQGGGVVARLRVAEPADRSQLTKEGESLFAGPASVIDSLDDAPGIVRQNHIERAAVDEIRAMMQIASAGGAARRNLGMIDYHDRMLDRAINTFGRVGG